MILKNGKRIDGCTDTLPVGTVQPFLGLTPPLGYLVCQGQLVSKAEYPELYKICGSTFGTETSTHFYLPDLRGKTIAGYDSSNSSMNSIGKLLGDVSHKHASPLTWVQKKGEDTYYVGVTNTLGNYFVTGERDFYGSVTNELAASSSSLVDNGWEVVAYNTSVESSFQPTITMNWIVKAAMLIPEYFVVENTLTSTSTSNALSAAQGKILNNKFSDYPTRAELLQYTNDYIIESGDKYRKWASGVAEAWGSCYEYADPMVGTSVGNVYRCDTPLQINLPAGVFVDTPNISTDLRYCTVVSWVGTLGYENNATQIRSRYIMSPVNLSNRTVEYYVDWYAIGKWK